MVESESDEKLVIETAQRDPRRFADLYRMHFDRVYAYIARRVATRSDAQDLTAEVFQQALAHLGRFEWRGVPFAAWLYRIAAHAVTDHHHRTVRDQHVPPNPPLGQDEHESAERGASLYRAVVNYLGDEEGGDPVAAAYGSNYARLQQLKATYDPNNFFHMNQNINLAR